MRADSANITAGHEAPQAGPRRSILELYLNVIEWGPGTYGAQPASESYYHKPASDLTAKKPAA